MLDDAQNPPVPPPPSPLAAPADVWSAHFLSASGRRYWPSEELVRSLSGRRYGVAVEAGCGDGGNLGLLSRVADRVVAIDACAEARALAQARVEADGLHNVLVVDGNLRAVPIALPRELDGGHADLLVDVQASQHLTWADHPVAYASYRRALAAGGRLVLLHFADGMTVGGAPPVELYTYAEIPPYPGVSPACVPTLAALKACVAEAGFHVDDWREVVRLGRGATIRYAILEATAT